MRFRVLIADCDLKGNPIGADCPFCGNFIGKNKMNDHHFKCGRKHLGTHKR